MNDGGNDAWLRHTELIGGAGCLDFINSVSNRFSRNPGEHLLDYAGLLVWLQRCGTLPVAASRRLLARSTHDPQSAGETLRVAVRLRDAAWRLLSTVTRGEKFAKADLDVVNRALDAALAHMELTPSDGKFDVRWKESDSLGSALWPVTRELMAFLTSGEMRLVRICADAECGWVFVDRSRNHLRRWCSMRDCGNRAKVRAHYQRQKTA
jgi:predicted RNA-binding Zn ribbon-like protein